MAFFEGKSGALVSLQDMRPSSPFFKQGTSVRIIGKLHEYSSETGLATVIDGNDILKVSTEHLKDLKFQVGSVYQFIGELLIRTDNEKGVVHANEKIIEHNVLCFLLGSFAGTCW
ncbi:CST complex subunit TEN1 isoform X2 [Medicago truncatula]|uniref:CST complex subunit TEN1 isoform X2 n=1 Tax=Medicago truncatula TaxID=3880 RepID=UPI000D2F2921|nr:CST complex subunit TEN1 isoform X2 [Medicago truncatula]